MTQGWYYPGWHVKPSNQELGYMIRDGFAYSLEMSDFGRFVLDSWSDEDILNFDKKISSIGVTLNILKIILAAALILPFSFLFYLMAYPFISLVLLCVFILFFIRFSLCIAELKGFVEIQFSVKDYCFWHCCSYPMRFDKYDMIPDDETYLKAKAELRRRIPEAPPFFKALIENIRMSGPSNPPNPYPRPARGEEEEGSLWRD